MGASVMAIVTVAMIGAFVGQSFLTNNARNMTAAVNDATRIMEQIRLQNTGTNCPSGVPSIVPPSGRSWNEWLDQGTTGKSVNPNMPAAERGRYELIAVTCQDGAMLTCQTGATVTCPGDLSVVTCPVLGAIVTCPDGTSVTPTPPYCGDLAGQNTPAQVGPGEWRALRGVTTIYNPIRVTVAVGWRQQQRAGSGPEFTYRAPSQRTWKGTIINEPEVFEVGPDADRDGVIESQAMLTTLVTCR